jgi:hypothetical protein
MPLPQLITTPLLDLAGTRVSSVEKIDYSWVFTFTGNRTITTDTAWRLIKGDRIEITSEGHGHQFGLPKPVDAATWVSSALRDLLIHSAHIEAATGDLRLFDGTFLQFLQMSSGYEAWQLQVHEDVLICLGGGKIDGLVRKC